MGCHSPPGGTREEGLPYQGCWWASVGPNQAGKIAILSHAWRQPASRSLESMGPLGHTRMVLATKGAAGGPRSQVQVEASV